jgi:Flp pilus assembly protein TadG
MKINTGAFAALAATIFQPIVRAKRGNVAMIFALAALPIFVAGGAGIDLSRALAVRSKLYAAVDAAALAVASKNGLSASDAQVLGQQYFNANYGLNPSFGKPQGVNVALANHSVTVSVATDMPTTLMNVVGFQHVNLTASSNVVWGQTKIWVGLALDNTGSMCQSDTDTSAPSPCPFPAANTKIAALKVATKSLLTMFKNAAAAPGDVQVSLNPLMSARQTSAHPGSTGPSGKRKTAPITASGTAASPIAATAVAPARLRTIPATPCPPA